ncbi:E3 ubiquitin-protein ligase-like [Iris pallida]|uniref:RING-type E3 ubiquitin transferase n=1 Tax=Iris pallida TaxID=29817 RepID=A0AAX6FGB4_IRIPA|nr:E3 ubiquitin-protein ligase-like [Iris pallida]
MGSICSCFCMEGLGEFMHSDASIYRHCVCLRCLAQRFIHMYTALIQQGEVRAIALSVQGTASSESSTPRADNFISDTYRSPPRPLPFDDPRCSRPQRDGLIFRRDKSSSHFHEEAESLRSTNDTSKESTSEDKLYGSNYEGGSKLFCSMSMSKNSSKEGTISIPYTCTSSEDEDVCPTCLEDYTPENPKIVMKCSHHFHLGCIYEWKERSDFCPVCGKVMMFDETE